MFDFTDYTAERTHNFTGREWAFARIADWLLGQPAARRVFLLGGGPGSGKTAFAARLAQFSQGTVAGPFPPLKQNCLAYAHFCRWNDDASLNPLDFVSGLSLALSRRYPIFAQALLVTDNPNIHIESNVQAGSVAAGGTVQGVVIHHLTITNISFRIAFDQVVRKPLEQLCASGGTGPIVILVDALDEAQTLDPEQNIAALLAHVTAPENHLPQPARFLLTGRFHDPRLRALFRAPDLDLIDHAPPDRDDVRQYAEMRLSARAGAQTKALAEKVAAASKGNFLYARYTLDELLTQDQLPADLTTLEFPDGLEEHYRRFIKRELAANDEKWDERYRPVLGLLSVAHSPGLTRQQLAAISGLSEPKTHSALKACAQYLDGRWPDGPFRIYHQSFLEFLQQDADFQVYPNEADARIADWYWTSCFDQAAGRHSWRTCDEYGLAYLPIHLEAASKGEHLRTVLLDYGWLQAKLDRLGVNALLADYALQTNSLAATDDAVQRVGRVLRQAAHVLAENPGQLAPQLLGRLLDEDHHEIDNLRNNIRQLVPRPCLLPQTASLRQSHDLLRVLVGHASPVKDVAVTRDGRIISLSFDGFVKIWELATGHELSSFQAHTESVNAICLTPDAQLLVSGSSDRTCKVWDLSSGRRLYTLTGHTEAVNAVAVTSDGRFVVSASADATVKVWDLSTGQALTTLVGHTGSVNAVAVTFGDRWIVSASSDGSVKVWDLADGQELRSFGQCRYAVDALAVTPDGQVAATVSSDNTFQVWDLAAGHVTQTLKGHPFGIHTVALTLDGLLVLSGAGSVSGGDNTIKVWNAKTGELRHTFQGHTDQVNAIVVSRDGQIVVSASSDHTLRLWDMGSIDRPADVPITSDWVNGLTATPDGLTIISASRNTLKVWGTDNCAPHRTLARRSEDTYIRSVAATPDGQRVISGSSDGAVQVWDIKSGAEYRTFRGHPARVYAVAMTPDGRQVVSASEDKTLKLWDLTSGTEIATLAGHNSNVYAVAVTPDGQFVVSGSADTTLKVWDLATNAIVRTLEGHDKPVYAVAVTSDGHAISASWDGTLKVWELASGTNIGTLQGHKDRVFGVAVTPDGRRVISAAQDQTLKVWELESGRCLATFHADGRLRACVALPGSGLIATGGNSGRVHFLRSEEAP